MTCLFCSSKPPIYPTANNPVVDLGLNHSALLPPKRDKLLAFRRLPATESAPLRRRYTRLGIKVLLHAPIPHTPPEIPLRAAAERPAPSGAHGAGGGSPL